MFRFRPPLIAAVLALVSIGLFASLLPQTSFVPSSSGEVVDGIGPVWPDSAVEQTLRDAPGIVSEIRIWAAAGFYRGEAPISASLLRRADRQPVRQVKVPVQASTILRPYILTFPPYKTVPGEDLVLQLWVSKVQRHGELATNHVVFGASAPRQDIAAPLVNRGSVEPRPLSYEVLWRGKGWRAALEGSKPDLVRLVGAIAVALIAVASYFRIPSRTMRRVRIAFLTITKPIGRTLRRAKIGRRSSLLRFRLRLISAVLALVSIGLLASLLPQTSFVPSSSGEVVDGIGPVWPDSAVEQTLRDAPGIVSEIRIWAAAEFDFGEALVVASLLQGHAEEPVRQFKVPVQASRILRPYILTFPPYKTVPGEDLVLQLWVSKVQWNGELATNHVVFGASAPRQDIAAPLVNRGSVEPRPLSYEVLWRGKGWRAALEGSKPDLVRLVGAIAVALIAVASYFRIPSRTMRRVRIAFLTITKPIGRTLRRAKIGRRSSLSDAEAPSRLRRFYVFPWLIPAFAILHYLANNLLLFRVSESVAVFVVAMAVVTGAFIAFRLVFKHTAVAALLTGLLGTAFFSYGHIYIALGERADHRLLFGLVVPTVLALGALVRGRPELARRLGTILNFGSLVLLAAPVYQIALPFYAASFPQVDELSRESVGFDRRVAEAKAKFPPDKLRDIYFIVLDAYPRSGSPEHFDNSAFVQELENRGFYVAPQARSNYLYTISSIPSSLNMRYVGEGNKRDQQETNRLLKQAVDHTLGRILKTLGYKYVHVSSGWAVTSTNSNADLVVDFTPSGRVISGADTRAPSLFATYARLSGRLTTTFLRTTAASPFLSHRFSAEDDLPYEWLHPFRTLAWLDFMKEVATLKGPKFVFAHLLKPHGPASFDKYGNIPFDLGGWSDDHDPTVSEPFYGQLIWLNGKMLEVIDAILDDYEEPPIMVIAGDHGHEREDPSISNDILAAYLLPDGGESAVYPSITSVNHFRAILDHYFGLNLGLLEDRVYNSGG